MYMNMVDLNGKRVLVTGGLGFIGYNFINYINRMYRNVYIVNIDKQGVGSNDPYSFNDGPLSNGNIYNYLNIDLSKSITELYTYEFDYIFHFAAESHVDRSIGSPISFIQNNILGITNLLEYVRTKCPKAKMVNISTDEVYGHLLSKGEKPFDKNSKLNPRSPYSASKASADLIVNSYVETYGIHVVTTRCCNNFGPHQFDEKFIPTIIKNIVTGMPVPIYGNGENIREWIHVEDHNKEILRVASGQQPGYVYHIGSGVEKSNLEIVKVISSLLKHYNPVFKFVEDRKGHDFRYALSIPYHIECRDFNDALKETVEFYVNKFKG